MELPNKCRIIKNFIGENLYSTLNNEITFNDVYRMNAICPSKISNQCDILENGSSFIYPIYRHPVDIEPKVYNWTPSVRLIKNKIKEIYPSSLLNHCLIRKYENGSNFIREHSDKTIDIADDSLIFNYSCGAERTFILKNKLTRETMKISLPNDSLFIMDLKTNEEYYHSIKKQSSIKEARISLTFRDIDSFKVNGKIEGKGQKYQDFINDELLEIYKNTNKGTYNLK